MKVKDPFILFFILLFPSVFWGQCLDLEQSGPIDGRDSAKTINSQVFKLLRSGDSDSDELKRCLHKAMALGKKYNDFYSITKSCDLLSRLLRKEGNHQKAKKYILQGLNIADSTKNYKNQARMLNALGVIESELGNTEKAISYYLKAKEIWKMLSKDSKALGLDVNIGCLYLDQKNYSQATQIFTEVLKKSHEINEDKYVHLSIINLGIIHYDLGNYKKSYSYFKQILDADGIKNQLLIQKATNYSSFLALKLGRKEEAKVHFNKAITNENERGKMELQLFWGDELIAQNSFEDAISKYFAALENAKTLNDIYIQNEIYEKLSKAFRYNGDFKLAWKYHDLYSQISDTLMSESKEKELSAIIANYEKREKDLRIEALENQRRSGRIIQAISILLAIVLMILCIVYFSRYKIKKNSSERFQVQNEKLIFQNTQIKAREILLKKKNQEIEEKNILLGQKSSKIKSQNKELHRYNKELEQFAYSVSHDLRAPIRSIHSFLHLIEKNLAKNENITDYLKIAQDNTQLLASLLDDLLTYTRVGRSEIPVVQVDLNKIIKEVCQSLDYEIKGADANIMVEDLPTVYGLPADMYLLFQNLVHNAIKFRSPDRRLELSITATIEDNSNQILIRDNGVGIKGEYLKKIFGVFQRIDNEKEGTGIGLAIVKKIIENSNGEIHVNSVLGEGTTFIITLPEK